MNVLNFQGPRQHCYTRWNGLIRKVEITKIIATQKNDEEVELSFDILVAEPCEKPTLIENISEDEIEFYETAEDAERMHLMQFDINYRVFDTNEYFVDVECGYIDYHYINDDGLPSNAHVKPESVVKELGKSTTVEFHRCADKIYRSYELCEFYNKHTIVRFDGTTEVRGGLAKRTCLTEEQLDAVKAIQYAFDKANELGVSVAIQDCEGRICAYRSDAIEFDWDDVEQFDDFERLLSTLEVENSIVPIRNMPTFSIDCPADCQFYLKK